MTGLIPRLTLFLAQFSRDKRFQSLLRQIAYLKEENRILRSKLPARITITLAERNRLVRLGKKLGPAIKELITIVTPRTFARWISEKSSSAKRPSKTGRRPMPDEIKELILHMARENGWGYTRILGELRKLGICNICRSTVVNILKSQGLDVGPKRGTGSWDEFIKTHVKTLWACDFFTQKVLTLHGWVDYYLILFVHLETRRLFITPATLHPTDQWMIQQAKNFLIYAEEQGLQVTHLIRDNDGKFSGGGFDAILQSAGAEIMPTSLRAPNMNPYSERAVQSVQTENLNHFIVLGERHLNYLISEYLAYYHSERPHQGKGNVLLTASATGSSPSDQFDSSSSSCSSGTPLRLKDIACHERLGGLLKHYYRQAA